VGEKNMPDMVDPAWRDKRYKYIVENIRDVIWELDTRLVFTYISPRDKEQRGYDPFEVIGQHLFTFLTDASQKYVLKATSEYAKTGEQGQFASVILQDVQQICKDGHVIWTEITINPVIQNGALIAFVGSTRDVSSLKRDEAKVQEYTERLEQLKQQLKRLSASDKFVRVVFNRDKLEKTFAEELTRAKRYKVNFSLVVFNLDFFKRINDTYGNLKGDDVIVELESVVSRFIRDTDSVFRRGGDEFIALLPHTTKSQGQTQAERLRKAIEDHQFPIAEKVTICAGVTEYVDGDTLETMIERADTALYIAKRGGHNQVVVR
jgi:diguanylate cyclase (GGDEF)-like protein/PAS domain S-box-containing protein